MVNLSSNNSNNVRISAGGQRNINVNSPTDNNINANNNGNSQRARSWAIGEGLIDGEDYSAKYWAEQAKISEEIARESIDAENNAHIWAEGTDEEVEAIGGTHSSKGWVDYVIENAPTASVEETEQGAVLTVTDINGTTTATIYNGADGQDGAPGQDGRDGTDGTDGQDGFSPIATVSKSGNTATISITDANGTTTTTITDGTNGTNGTDGQDGEDGFSPTATVTKSGNTATITITDKNGTTTANVYDGTGSANDATITITQGGVTKGTFTTNQSSNATIALDAGGSGGGSYSAGTGIVISNDTISIDTSVVAELSDIPTNYVTTDTAQDISGRKTFLGEKAIYFKQSTTTDKLGFTLYNSSNTELGAFEWRPNTISGGALLNINVPYSSSNYVGFRYWGTAVNIIAPKVATAGNYYIPTHITNGNTTVTANSSGTVDISSLVGGGGSGGIQNTATGTDSLTILGTASTADYSVNIGINSEINADEGVAIGCEASTYSGVAIGRGAEVDSGGGVAIGKYAGVSNNGDIAIGDYAGVNGTSAIALGYQASATASNAIQIGNGENTTSNTMQVWNYPLLDKTTGLIPDARISSNIARTSQIPTAISDLTDDTATTPIDKAESVVDNNSGSLNFWSGTKAQYDAIVTKDANTLYNVTDDANPTLSILEMLYPVGSIYIGTMSACPLQTLGVGTWQLKTSRFLVEKKEPDSNDNRWYNLYSDGYCEQGGIITITLNGSRTGYATPTFIKQFRDTNDVSAFAQGGYIPNVSGMAYNVNNVTTSSMQIQAITVDRTSATSGTPNPCYYRVSGYILQTSIVNQWERIS